MQPTKMETLNLAPRDAEDPLWTLRVKELGTYVVPSWKRAAISIPRSLFGSRCQIARCCRHRTNPQHSQCASGSCLYAGFEPLCFKLCSSRQENRAGLLTASQSMRYAPRGGIAGEEGICRSRPPCSPSSAAANERHHSSPSAFFFTPPSARDQPRNHPTSIRIQPLHEQNTQRRIGYSRGSSAAGFYGRPAALQAQVLRGERPVGLPDRHCRGVTYPGSWRASMRSGNHSRGCNS